MKLLKLPELLAPAGSPDGVRAAVQSGATAVYMGFGTFNARRGAQNFSPDEMASAIAYCRARGVKTNITLNILVSDRELDAALHDARFLYEAGADALIIQDLGLARLIHAHAPSLALHASTQLTISTLDGAKMAKEFGFSRIVLARETPLQEIRRITAEGGVETEIFIHGALCRCYSGQCWLSAVIGRRSGNRGLCAQPCRLPYRYDGKGPECFPLSLKDLSLAHHIPEICSAGVSSLKIEGRMKRPEYTAVVTRVYAALLHEQRGPTPAEEDALRRVFSRDGFTDGYFTGRQGDEMLGTKTELPLHEVQPFYDEAARLFADGKEAPLVPVSLSLQARTGEPLTLTASDGVHTVCVTGAAAEPAHSRPTEPARAEKALRKTGGTPFAVQTLDISLENGPAIPAAALNALRRDALHTLLTQREQPPAREPWKSAALPSPAFREVTLTADGTGLHLHLWDGIRDGITVFDTAPVPQDTGNTSNAPAQQWVSERFGTSDAGTHLSIKPGLALPEERLDRLAVQALEQYHAQLHRHAYKGMIIEARSFEQLSPALLETQPQAIYLPLTELAGDVKRTRELVARLPLAAVLPRVFFDHERSDIFRMLTAVRQAGVTAGLAGNIGHIALLRELDMEAYGDFGLNAFQSATLAALAGSGIRRQTLSFELRLEQVRDLHAPLETELIVYGHLPLMIFELCAIRHKSGQCTCKSKGTRLTDRTGRAFPLLPEYGCRNTLLNGVPLALHHSELPEVDLARLRFTIEPPGECARIAQAFCTGQRPDFLDGTTRGLYRRGVE